MLTRTSRKVITEKIEAVLVGWNLEEGGSSSPVARRRDCRAERCSANDKRLRLPPRRRKRENPVGLER